MTVFNQGSLDLSLWAMQLHKTYFSISKSIFFQSVYLLTCLLVHFNACRKCSTYSHIFPGNFRKKRESSLIIPPPGKRIRVQIEGSLLQIPCDFSVCTDSFWDRIGGLCFSLSKQVRKIHFFGGGGDGALPSSPSPAAEVCMAPSSSPPSRRS